MPERKFTMKKGSSEYPDAFDGTEIMIPFPALGTDPEATLTLTGPVAETVQNILDDVDGDHKILYATFVPNRILDRQKAVKAEAGSKATAEALKTEGGLAEVIAKLIEIGSSNVGRTIRELAGTTGTGRKPSAGAIANAKAEVKAEAQAKLADMSPEDRAEAEKYLKLAGLL